MKAYGTVEVWFHTFLISAADGGEQQLHGPAASVLWDRVCHSRSTDPRAGRDSLEITTWTAGFRRCVNDIFALPGCHATLTGSYRRFVTAYLSCFQGSKQYEKGSGQLIGPMCKG
jgi:hypothetical protein